MLRTVRTSFLAGLFVLAASTAAQADGLSTWNTLNRKLGLGWSDGYHAYNGGGDHCGWVSEQAPPVASGPVPHAAPRPTPPTSSRRGEATLRTSQRPATGPLLPSQKSTPRPAYWYR